MIRINVSDAKRDLSRLLDRVERGETVVLCRRNVPIAEIGALPRSSTKRRPIGLARGQFTVGRSFFDALPADLLDAFEGRPT